VVEGVSARVARTLDVAQLVADVFSGQGVEVAVIGAMALAAHGYARSTEDFDLATSVDPFKILPGIVEELQKRGLRAVLRQPDADDPLGGVIDVEGDDFDLVQVVNFLNPWAGAGSALGAEAISTATRVAGSPFRIVDVPHLVALKLEAGGPQDRGDVVELLARNPEADLARIREVCRRFGHESQLEALLAER
jgi:hypothetical protein